MQVQRMICDVKKTLPFKEANAVIKKLRLRGCKSLLMVYRCQECHQFHIGGREYWCKEQQIQMEAVVREQRRSRRTGLGRD